MSNFKSYTRKTAFSLNLSDAQIEIILLSRKKLLDDILEIQHHLVTLGSLTRKGLVTERSFDLTEEGYIVSSLLIMAGFDE